MRLYKIIFTDKEFAEDSIYKLPLFQLEKLKDNPNFFDYIDRNSSTIKYVEIMKKLVQNNQ